MNDDLFSMLAKKVCSNIASKTECQQFERMLDQLIFDRTKLNDESNGQQETKIAWEKISQKLSLTNSKD